MPSFDADETRFVNVIEWSVELLTNLQDADEVSTSSSEVVARITELLQAYGTEGVNSMLDHIRDAKKFENERNIWKEQLKLNWRRQRTVQLKCQERNFNFDKDLKSTVDQVKVYLLHRKEIAEEERKSTSADMGTVMAHLQSKHQEMVEDVDPWAEYSLLDEDTVKLDLNGTPRVDRDPGKHFWKLVEKGPTRARNHFQREMRRFVQLVTNAKNSMKLHLTKFGSHAEKK